MKTKFFAALIAMIAIFVCGPAKAQKMTIFGNPKPKVAEGVIKVEGNKKIGSVQKAVVDLKILQDIDKVRIFFKTWGGLG